MISIIFFLVMFVGLVFLALYIGKEFPTSIARTELASPMLREKYNMNSADRFTAAFDKFQTQVDETILSQFTQLSWQNVYN